MAVNLLAAIIPVDLQASLLYLGGLAGTAITAFSVAKNKGYEAQKKATESWKDRAEATELDLKDERAKTQELKDKNVELEKRVALLEARPDLSFITTELASIKKAFVDYTTSNTKMLKSMITNMETNTKTLKALTDKIGKT